MKLRNGDMIGEIEFLMEKGKELKRKKSKQKEKTRTTSLTGNKSSRNTAKNDINNLLEQNTEQLKRIEWMPTNGSNANKVTKVVGQRMCTVQALEQSEAQRLNPELFWDLLNCQLDDAAQIGFQSKRKHDTFKWVYSHLDLLILR